MPETQIISPVSPSVKVSSMDNTKMLTHPAVVPPRAGTQKPRREIAGVISPRQPNVVMKQMPVEIKVGRADRMTAPERERSETTTTAQAAKQAVGQTMPEGAPALLLYLIEKHLAETDEAELVALQDENAQPPLATATAAWLRTRIEDVGSSK